MFKVDKNIMDSISLLNNDINHFNICITKRFDIYFLKTNIEVFRKNVNGCWFQWITGQEALKILDNLVSKISFIRL